MLVIISLALISSAAIISVVTTQITAVKETTLAWNFGFNKMYIEQFQYKARGKVTSLNNVECKDNEIT